MFRIISSPRAWWPVTFPGVTEEGTVVENRFELRFVILDEDAHLSLMQDARVLIIDGEAAEAAKDKTQSALAADFVKRVAEDWRQVGGANGEPLPWNDDNLQKLLNMPNVFAAVIAAYRDCRRGGADIRAGN